MAKVISSSVKKSKTKAVINNYSKEDIALAVLIGLQCVTAFSIIIYHIF